VNVRRSKTKVSIRSKELSSLPIVGLAGHDVPRQLLLRGSTQGQDLLGEVLKETGAGDREERIAAFWAIKSEAGALPSSDQEHSNFSSAERFQSGGSSSRSFLLLEGCGGQVDHLDWLEGADSLMSLFLHLLRETVPNQPAEFLKVDRGNLGE